MNDYFVELVSESIEPEIQAVIRTGDSRNLYD